MTAFSLLATVGSLFHDVKADSCVFLLSDRATPAIATNEWKNAFRSFWEIFPPNLNDLEALAASDLPTNPALSPGIVTDPRAVAFKRLFEFLIQHQASEWRVTREFIKSKIEEISLRNIEKEEAQSDSRDVFQLTAVEPSPEIAKGAREYFQKFQDGSFLLFNSTRNGKKGVLFSLPGQSFKFLPFPKGIAGGKLDRSRKSTFAIKFNDKQQIHQISDKQRGTTWIIDHKRGLEFIFAYSELEIEHFLPFRKKDGSISLLETATFTGGGKDNYYIHEIPQNKDNQKDFSLTLATRGKRPLIKIKKTSEHVFEVSDDGTPYVVCVSDRNVQWINLETFQMLEAYNSAFSGKHSFYVMRIDDHSISLAQSRLDKSRVKSLRVFKIERKQNSKDFKINKTVWRRHEDDRLFDAFEFRQGETHRRFLVINTQDSIGNFLMILDLKSGEIRRLSLPKDHPLVRIGGFTYAHYLLTRDSGEEEPRVFIFIDHPDFPLVADLNLQTGQLITFPHEEIWKRMGSGFLKVLGVRIRNDQTWSVIIAEEADFTDLSEFKQVGKLEEFLLFGPAR